MLNMMETYKAFGEGKDLESFQIGYFCRQEHIDILQEENIRLQGNKDLYHKRFKTVESITRLFEAFLKHENSECGHCLICSNMWNIIDMINEKLQELKKIN